MSRPKTVISMKSKSLSWPSAALGLTAYFVSKKRFRYGDVFTVDGPLADDTSMDATLIFAQSILDPALATVQLRDYRVTLSQFYPLYSSEIPLYDRLGLERFGNHPGIGTCDPHRPPIFSNSSSRTKSSTTESFIVVRTARTCQHLSVSIWHEAAVLVLWSRAAHSHQGRPIPCKRLGATSASEFARNRMAGTIFPKALQGSH